MNNMKLREYLWGYLVAFIMILLMQPGFMWGIDPFPIRILLILILLINLDIHEDKQSLLLFFFFCVLSIYPVTHDNSLFGFIFFTTLAFIPFVKKRILSYSFLIFKKLLAYLTLVSLIMWILVVVLGVNLPYTVVSPLNELKDYDYRSYFFLLVPLKITDFDILKFNCIFDEPGVVGTYSLLMLISNNFNWKNKENWVFFLSGIVAFSFFFYLGLLLFALMNVFVSNVARKYKISAVFLSIAFIVAIQTIPLVNDMVGHRLEFDSSTGKLAGDNRSSEDLDSYISSIKGSYAYFFGDRDEIVEEYLANAGLNTAILRYGLVLIILYIVFFVMYSYYTSGKNRREAFLFMLAILATIYQRPGLVNPPFIFMFVGIVINRAIKYNTSIKRIEKWKV